MLRGNAEKDGRVQNMKIKSNSGMGVLTLTWIRKYVVRSLI